MNPASSSTLPRRRWPILAAFALALALVLGVFRVVTVRNDMVDFLPAGETPAARLMLGELRSGAATNLILVGIEGAPVTELARISRDMATRLRASGLFSLLENGPRPRGGPEQDFLFAHRYQLSADTTPEAFAVDALHRDFQRILELFRSSAATFAEQYGLGDPPGIFFALARQWMGDSDVRILFGAWFARGSERTLMLARTQANGLDTAAQEKADTEIRSAFASANPGEARLIVTGPAIFARDAARAIRSDVELLTICSTLLVAALLFWRFRSLWVIATIAVPILLSIAVAALAVQAAFGFVHGITLGFGMTMLGVSVDYPVLLIGHRKRAEVASATLRRIGFSFNLAVLTACLGLTGMVFSGFNGIAQLGCFAVVGLLVAAGATRWLLPGLIVAADLAPVAAGDPRQLLRVEVLRRYRALAAVPVLAALLFLAVRPPHLERELANLSPVPKQAMDRDTELRGQIGAPDVGHAIVLRGATAEQVLQRGEALLPALEALKASGGIGGYESAARFLPSAETQRRRMDAVPPQPELANRVAAAAKDSPFKAEAFEPFLEAVADARHAKPLGLSDMTPPLIQARLQPLIFERDGKWYGLVVPRRLADPQRFAAIATGIPDAAYLDIGREANAMVATYTAQAWRWLLFGGLAALAALAFGLRDALQVGRVMVAIGCAVLVTVAILTAMGSAISLLHIVSLQLVAGVGFDYALFFARRQLDDEERARTLRTLVTCNGMTLLTFGVLAFCHTPLLREIGLTVAVGVVAAICFTFLLVGPARPGSVRLRDA